MVDRRKAGLLHGDGLVAAGPAELPPRVLDGVAARLPPHPGVVLEAELVIPDPPHSLITEVLMARDSGVRGRPELRDAVRRSELNPVRLSARTERGEGFPLEGL